MFRVIKAHVEAFNRQFEISEDIDRSYEAFVNHIILRRHSGDTVDPSELIYHGDDPGIDGVLFFIDNSYVSSVDEVDAAFKSNNRDRDVITCIVQTKSSEFWSKKEIGNFNFAVLDFLSEDSRLPQDGFVSEKREIFDRIIKNVGKLRSGKPRAEMYFATTARASEDREILAAFDVMQREVMKTGLFSSVVVEALDRDKVVELWRQADGPVEATLPVFAIAAFPKAVGIAAGYVATVRAKEFVKFLLSDSNGKLRQNIFEENVRDFIGLDVDVNREMRQTIAIPEKQSRFGLLNNGVTVVSSDVRLAGNELFIRDYQIVNGCQTSNVLFDAQNDINEDATVMLKIIHIEDDKIVDEIVRSTNKQTKVEDEQFLATLDCVKSIERFFDAKAQEDSGNRLYFERRKNQHRGQASDRRIFDIREIARCVGSMFFDKPDIASRYPNRLTDELAGTVFRRENVDDIYYAATYSLYRLQTLLSNNRISANYTKFRWHILMAIKYYVCGDKIWSPTSPKVARDCEAIEKFMIGAEGANVAELKALCDAIVPGEAVTSDKLRSQTLVQEVIRKAKQHRENHKPERKKRA